MRLVLGALLLAVVVSGCSDHGKKAGKDACETYKLSTASDPQVIADTDALNQIKADLDKLDAPTRRAFAALITAADANPFASTTDPTAVDRRAEDVRSVCLSEHSVDIPSP